ncbi:MAG TPA: choice-of-anchor E domain-containing protein [Chitinophagaceae bacterium]
MKKQLYTILFIVGSCFAAIEKTQAQCPCANGDTPDSIVYTFTLPPTSDFSSAITFPKFNPTTGTLNCVSLIADITAVANLGIRNRDSLPRDYQFLYTQAISVSGPGSLFTNANTTQNYGPTTLAEYGQPGDSVHYGPDTPFLNRRLSRTISNVSPYLGTGNVTLNFNNTGSTLLLQGSNNYQATITTFAWGEFRLVYYYCRTSVLANGIKGFTATKKDKHILLEWVYENEPSGTQYDVELSKDGYNFKSISKRSGNNNGAAGQVKYNHQYQLKGDEDKLYFRIGATDISGDISYSPIRIIQLSSSPGAYSVSPNPVRKHASISFARPQTGDYGVEIINSVGQTIYKKTYSLSNESLIEVDLPQQQNPGLYYLRINNLSTKEQLVQKILLQ